MTDSGRQIKTPADAVPHTDINEIIKNLTISVALPSFVSGTFTGEIYPYFTAAECAQIALSYGECIAAEMTTGGDHGEEWRATFSEWEKQT